MNILLKQLIFEFKIKFNNNSGYLNPFIFFIIINTIFAIALGGNTELLAKIAIPVIWTVALLSILLSLENLFDEDYKEGIIEQILISQRLTYGIISIKIFVNWITSGLLIILVLPFIFLFFNLNFSYFFVFVLSLTLGSMALNSVGALANTMFLGQNKANGLMAIIILPLMIPIIIFAINGISLLEYQANSSVALLYLFALTLIYASLAPFGVVFLLKSI